MLTIYNIPQNTADQGFDELDANKDQYISADEMVEGLKNLIRTAAPEQKHPPALS